MALSLKINKTPQLTRNCCQHSCSLLYAMAEGTYEYECMRAELLGVAKPDYDDFLQRQKDEQLAKEVAEEQIETECLTNVNSTNATASNISSRLDELNTILASTQKRINRFKTSCGSFTNMLKARISRQNSNSSLNVSENVAETLAQQETTTMTEGEGMSQRKVDLCRGLDGNLDKLDSLLDKAETAHYNMSDQRKQMNKFLN